MTKRKKTMSSIEMRTLILEALSIDDPENTPLKRTFPMYEYKGCISDLRAIVEFLAIKHGLIDEVAKTPLSAWGTPGGIWQYGQETSLSDEEVNLFTEEFHLLMFQNVLSPGAQRYYGDSWPYFHVTKYGLECLKKQDILPYDPDGYMKKINNISSIDDWEIFYIYQSLVCYNAGAFESSIIMLGLAGEYLATRLIDSMGNFLFKQEPTFSRQFSAALKGKNTISQRYNEYENILKKISALKFHSGNNKYPQLNSLSPSLDGAAKSVYATYLRLTRNELAHPSQVKLDRIECLTLVTSYIKYCETQHKYLDFYVSNS